MNSRGQVNVFSVLRDTAGGRVDSGKELSGQGKERRSVPLGRGSFSHLGQRAVCFLRDASSGTLRNPLGSVLQHPTSLHLHVHVQSIG